MKMSQPTAGPFLAEFHPCGWLAVDIFFRLQAFHVALQVGFVRIGRRRERGLHFFYCVVEITLAAINAGHTDMRRPLAWELLRVRTIKRECFFLLLLTLQLAAIEIKLLPGRFF